RHGNGDGVRGTRQRQHRRQRGDKQDTEQQFTHAECSLVWKHYPLTGRQTQGESLTNSRLGGQRSMSCAYTMSWPISVERNRQKPAIFLGILARRLTPPAHHVHHPAQNHPPVV